MPIPVAHSILRTLAYFELFQHPLTAQELLFFLDQPVAETELQSALQQLLQEHRVFNHNGFYALQNQPAYVDRRKQYNAHAKELLPVAHRIGKLLSRFPYVSGICISGSLSKEVASTEADLDFFIITKPGRLWIARTCMHLLKKLSFLAGKQHWFCMNYYVDESMPLIRERNYFTAIEMLTLLPVAGSDALPDFFHANEWVQEFLPSYAGKELPPVRKDGILKKIAEWMFSNRMGDQLDNFLMRLTTKRWKQKEDNFQLNMKGGRMGLDADKHYCKPNPIHFQEPLLARYQKRVAELLDQPYVMVS
ncbi:MAG: hypothetical protein ACTHMC_23925 [Pseudobacter sp.]|uniref:hypothetical protein n=1 Tax=Pseudobacter sp. TaxID=2045420 RepID=UPI003F80ABB1